VVAPSAHRKRIGSEPKRKSAVSRRLATKKCALATRGYALRAALRGLMAPLPFQIIRDRFDGSFVLNSFYELEHVRTVPGFVFSRQEKKSFRRIQNA
jgi:hypothetical protein